jgi:hypothetical protein
VLTEITGKYTRTISTRLASHTIDTNQYFIEEQLTSFVENQLGDQGNSEVSSRLSLAAMLVFILRRWCEWHYE